jgi:hypothetical protein
VEIGDTSNCHGWKFLKTTVLECMLKHFKKGFTGDYGIKMSPGRLRTLCESEWPLLGSTGPMKEL